jgi:4-hydroxy-3-methylbut-2-en-1-yl diphosphate reductase
VSEGLLIAAPMRVEQALVAAALGSGAGSARAITRTGMGPAHARDAARRLAGLDGRALLVLGFCGGLDEHSVPGEVIVAERVRAASDEGHDPEPVDCADPEGLSRRLTAGGLQVRSGEIVSVSRLAVGERRAELLNAGALAVDMESAWLARGGAGRPFAVVRVVLDSPSHELLRPGALVGAPRAARALGRVARALRHWLPPEDGGAHADTGLGSSRPRGGVR